MAAIHAAVVHQIQHLRCITVILRGPLDNAVWADSMGETCFSYLQHERVVVVAALLPILRQARNVKVDSE